MILNCIIIDDEPLATDLLKSYAEKVSFLNVIGAYNSAVEAIKEIKNNPIDIIFLDIQMPELSGLEFSKILPPTTNIVFTTAFKQYAIDGYKVNALDYMLKPISFDTFVESCNKALCKVSREHKISPNDQDRFIFIKSDYKLIKINFDDIAYIEGLKDYVKFYLTNDEPPVMSLMNMRSVEEKLPKPEFLRSHRSYIVHLPMVKMVDRMRFVIGDSYIPISESYKDSINKFIEIHTLS